VNAAYGISGGHGFSVTVPLQPGSNNVCAYAIGVASGNNVLIGCRVVQYVFPVGNFDYVGVSGAIANVAGWAFDPVSPGQSIPVDVYVNGRGVRLAADKSRADVNAVMGVSGQHGFSGSVALQPGDNSICAYAIGLSGNNPSLGCRTVRLSPPLGSFDFAANAGGVANIAGWAFDPSASGQSIPVHAYVNGVPYALMADGPRADVNAVMGVSGQHGFAGSVPLQTGANSVCVYAIGLVAGNNPFLGCRSVPVAAPFGNFDFAADAGGVANVSGWAVDPNSPVRSISVDVYVNGRGVRLSADQPRADVNAVMGVSGQHGFSGSVQLQPGSNDICAFAISVAAGGNRLLGCRQVQSAGQAAAVQQAVQQPPAPVSPTTVVVQQPSSTSWVPDSSTAPESATASVSSSTATSAAAPSVAAPPDTVTPSASTLAPQSDPSVSGATAPVTETSTG
jgi:hypothetical protein